MLEEIVVEVGARAIDDRRKIKVEGALIRPDTKQDTKHRDIGILFVGGLNTRWESYIDYFSRQIGERWPIYVTELRSKGRTYGHLLANDIVQVDAHVRDRLETNRLVYFVHSMGGPIAVEASRRHAKQVRGYLFMATYPSYEECFRYRKTQSLVNRIGQSRIGKRYFGWFAYPLSKAKLNAPTHFVMGNRDEILYWSKEVFNRIKNYFESIGGTVEVIPGNHVFNRIPLHLRPFNKSYQRPLLQQAFDFMERLIE